MPTRRDVLHVFGAALLATALPGFAADGAAFTSRRPPNFPPVIRMLFP